MIETLLRTQSSDASSASVFGCDSDNLTVGNGLHCNRVVMGCINKMKRYLNNKYQILLARRRFLHRAQKVQCLVKG